MRNVRRSATVLAIAAIAIFTACATVKNPDTDPGSDADIDAAVPPDAPPIEEARLTLTFDGPASGSNIRVATNDAHVLCFIAKATHRPQTLDRLQFQVDSVEGLFVDNWPQYSGWVLHNESGDILGTAVPTTSNANLLSLAVTTDIQIPIDVDRQFCLSSDIANEDLLAARHLNVKLLPLVAGDVSMTDDGTDLPVDHIVMDAIETSLNVIGINGTDEDRSPPQMAPPENWWGGSLQLNVSPMPPTEINIHRMKVTAPPGHAVLIKQATYSLQLSFLEEQAAPDGTVIVNARLDMLEMPTQPSGSWSVQSGGDDCINLVATSRTRCVRVNLNVPLVIPAGETRNLDLYVTVSGDLVHNEIFTTEALPEFFGSQEGPLSRGVIGRGALNKGTIWSNDGLWWYNGYAIHWGSRYRPTFRFFSP